MEHRIAPKPVPADEALALLEQAFAYYRPEPVLVPAAETGTDEPWIDYYDAAA